MTGVKKYPRVSAGDRMALTQMYGEKYVLNHYGPEEIKEDTDMILEAKEGFRFGCDPEIFIKRGDVAVSAGEAGVPGTKAEPFKVPGGAIQRDGMAAEINIDPVTTFSDFNKNINLVLRALEDIIPKDCTLDYSPSIRFSPEAFERTSDIDKALGCTPDFNAWTGDINPPPSPDMIGDPFLRTAAGHLHIGWTEDADLTDAQHLMNCRDLVKQLDWYLGAWSVGIDTDATRRLLYGKAGACRYKSYGVEYRVLSNFWLTTRDRRLAVWNRTMQAIDDMRNRFMPDKTKAFYSQAVMSSINTSVPDKQLKQNFRFPIQTIDTSYSRV